MCTVQEICRFFTAVKITIPVFSIMTPFKFQRHYWHFRKHLLPAFSRYYWRHLKMKAVVPSNTVTTYITIRHSCATYRQQACTFTSFTSHFTMVGILKNLIMYRFTSFQEHKWQLWRATVTKSNKCSEPLFQSNSQPRRKHKHLSSCPNYPSTNDVMFP
jgi:hypothetical protein